MAIKAGVDVVLFPPNVGAAIEAIEAAVKKGEITESRIDESVRRLLNAKYRSVWRKIVLLIWRRQIAGRKAGKRARSNRDAEKSITLLRNGETFLPMTKEKANKTLFVVIAADDDPIEGAAFMPEIQKRAPNAKIVRLDPRSTPKNTKKF
jgi:beta-N-acetylhexosaminidase